MRARRVFVYIIDVPPQVNVVRLGFEDAGMAPFPPRFFRNFLDETVKALAFCLVINTFSAVTTDASLLVPSSTNDLTNSMWQSGEICQVLSTEAFTSFCHTYDGTMGSSLQKYACPVPPHVAEKRTVLCRSRAPVLPTQ